MTHLADYEDREAPIRRILKDTLLDAFKFLRRKELCRISEVSNHFHSLINHPALRSRHVIDQEYQIRLNTSRDSGVLFSDWGWEWTTTFGQVKCPPSKCAPPQFILFSHIIVSLWIERNSGFTAIEESAKSVIETLKGNAESIELSFHFLTGAVISELNDFFSSLGPSPHFNTILISHQRSTDLRVFFNSKFLQIPSVIDCNRFWIFKGAFSGIDELQLLVDFLHHPVPNPNMFPTVKTLKLSLRSMTDFDHSWLVKKLEERFIHSTESHTYELQINMSNPFGQEWTDRNLENSNTGETLHIAYKLNYYLCISRLMPS